MQVVERFEHAGKIIRIALDEDPESPREWDNLGTIVCWHRRYDLGDRHPTAQEREALDRGGFRLLQRYLSLCFGVKHILKLGLLDHSGLHMYVGGGPHYSDSAGWDSGTVGWVMALPEDIKKMGRPDEAIEVEDYVGPLGGKVKMIRNAIEYGLRCEVETYDQYLRGEVYGYVITRKHDPDCDDDDCRHDEHVDSCWGFFGIEYVKQEAMAAAEAGKDEADAA